MNRNTGHTLLLRPRDPLIFRDARPFAAEAGARARTLDWPLPQTVAGALRSHIGRQAGVDWGSDEERQRARATLVHGPLLATRAPGDTAWTICFPSPRDALPYEADGDKRVWCLRPVKELPADSGSDLPAGLLPMAMNPAADFKPSGGDPFWSLDATVAWLKAPIGAAPPGGGVAGPGREARMHVAIDAKTGTSATGLLFSTEALAFADAARRPRRTADDDQDPGTRPALALVCRLTGARAWRAAPALLPLGGERRLVALDPAAPITWPEPPKELVRALTSNGNRRVRLQLVTPALFGRGWLPDGQHGDHFAPVPAEAGPDAARERPGRLPPRPDAPHQDRDLLPLEGFLPDLQDVGPRLRLVGAIVGRRAPVSGWSLTDNGSGERKPGAKAVRYAVPAGSVYFFEAQDALTERDVQRLWLRSICGRQQDRLDGDGGGRTDGGTGESTGNTARDDRAHALCPRAQPAP